MAFTGVTIMNFTLALTTLEKFTDMNLDPSTFYSVVFYNILFKLVSLQHLICNKEHSCYISVMVLLKVGCRL